MVTLAIFIERIRMLRFQLGSKNHSTKLNYHHITPWENVLIPNYHIRKHTMSRDRLANPTHCAIAMDNVVFSAGFKAPWPGRSRPGVHLPKITIHAFNQNQIVSGIGSDLLRHALLKYSKNVEILSLTIRLESSPDKRATCDAENRVLRYFGNEETSLRIKESHSPDTSSRIKLSFHVVGHGKLGRPGADSAGTPPIHSSHGAAQD